MKTSTGPAALSSVTRGLQAARQDAARPNTAAVSAPSSSVPDDSPPVGCGSGAKWRAGQHGANRNQPPEPHGFLEQS